jgi:hypothetical protein
MYHIVLHIGHLSVRSRAPRVDDLIEGEGLIQSSIIRCAWMVTFHQAEQTQTLNRDGCMPLYTFASLRRLQGCGP